MAGIPGRGWLCTNKEVFNLIDEVAQFTKEFFGISGIGAKAGVIQVIAPVRQCRKNVHQGFTSFKKIPQLCHDIRVFPGRRGPVFRGNILGQDMGGLGGQQAMLAVQVVKSGFLDKVIDQNFLQYGESLLNKIMVTTPLGSLYAVSNKLSPEGADFFLQAFKKRI